MAERVRYEKLAKVLLSSPDPVHAIASLIGDHEGRLDGLVERVLHLEAVVAGMRATDG